MFNGGLIAVEVFPPPRFHKYVRPLPVVELLVDRPAEKETTKGGRHAAGGDGFVLKTTLGFTETLMY
ncbi:MAG: hypothetical protein BWY67_01843 [Bacteroidetes bacterium ADurb.Bin397]|nr:MAG: hypothetical protein BWY67_01843 [Bacteroidetes bacterium ADurb.Bin397]